MKILVSITIGMLIIIVCFIIFLVKTSKPVVEKYELNFNAVSKLEHGAFDEKFLKKILQEMNSIKIEEYKWGGIKVKKYTEYYFLDESGGSDLRIEVLPKYSVNEAIEEFELDKSGNSKDGLLYESKNNERTRYYGTYQIQFRNDMGGLMDMYSTYLGIQNNTIVIKMIDYSGNTNKEKIQKYINMFGEAATKE
jgi:hypothetical protein